MISTNKIERLYDSTTLFDTSPSSSHPHTINMFSLIKKNTTAGEFKNALKENYEYKHEITGGLFANLGQTGLIKSVIKNNLNLTKYFIENLAADEIDSICVMADTALHKAIRIREKSLPISILPILIEWGYPGFSEEEDKTNFSIIHQLLLAGADANLAFPELSSDFHNSALKVALEIGDLLLIKLLINFGAEKQCIIKDKKLIKEGFGNGEKIYKQAKYEIRCARTYVILGAKDENCWFSCLPQELIKLILTCAHIERPHAKKAYEARCLKEAEKLKMMNL